jgi:CheY-like chemotaxis protein
MQVLCEQLECKNARWRERLLALSATSVGLATGRLQFAESAPSLFIAAASQTQANSAAELAGQLGFTTQIAHTGKEALDRIKEFSPQVILTDGTLPDMDAKTFAHAARKALGSKPAIIIAWSSNPEAEETLLDTDTGIDDFVLKSTTNEGTEMLAAALLGGVA